MGYQWTSKLIVFAGVIDVAVSNATKAMMSGKVLILVKIQRNC